MVDARTERVDVAEVVLWGRVIGAVAWDEERKLGTFEYTREFRGSGIQLAPLTMPLGGKLYTFPGLERETFSGLPGLLADSLPDKFGNALIDRWLARQGRDRSSFSPVEQLCYTGARGMGALEFRPALWSAAPSEPLALDALVELAAEVLAERRQLQARVGGEEDAEALDTILRVGTSAGGARAKAVIAWNPETGEIRSGQVPAPAGFEYWLLKFDGVTNRDKELADPAGYGLIEYAYSEVARAAGIHMSPCRLLRENGRSHFMTRRFDRADDGSKLHMQSLCAMGHLDFNLAGAHGYEQALRIMEDLGLPRDALREQYRRMLFNVVLRNQDDHTKNIAFLMDRSGQWRLSPAFDLTFAYNPKGAWTGQHQMSIAGKRDDFTREDLFEVARAFRIRRPEEVLAQVCEAARTWPEHAREAGVAEPTLRAIAETHRLGLGEG